jgi:hypothetical protein
MLLKRAEQVKRWETRTPLENGKVYKVAFKPRLRAEKIVRVRRISGDTTLSHVLIEAHLAAAERLRNSLGVYRVPNYLLRQDVPGPVATAEELPKSWLSTRLWVSRRPGESWTAEGLVQATEKARCAGLKVVGE